MNLLKNQVALITGGSSGIGKAIAIKFAESGARLILFGTNLERGEAVVKEIQEALEGSHVRFYQVDVGNHEAVKKAVQEILLSYGNVEILVNNAGITRDQLIMRMTEEDWDSVMAVNVKSCYNLCHALVRSMMKAKRGKIINVSSVVGLTGNSAQTNYAASKAAVIGFTKALAKELSSRQINVNCLAPGFIVTKMTDVLTETQKEQLLNRIPLARFGVPEEIANVALFLASRLSDYMTGQVISVDGGLGIN